MVLGALIQHLLAGDIVFHGTGNYERIPHDLQIAYQNGQGDRRTAFLHLAMDIGARDTALRRSQQIAHDRVQVSRIPYIIPYYDVASHYGIVDSLEHGLLLFIPGNTEYQREPTP